MTSGSTVQTAHGLMDASALEAVRDSFDTSLLLQSVDEIDEVVRQLSDDGGLRDQLLQLHAMASTVLNGAGMSSSSGETLSDAASDVIDDVREIVSVLRRAADRVAPLAPLASRE
ncbi:MAG: hypothetical protein K9J82_19025 [Methylotenera sp.]|jgi:hypothetical protein|nr:hypothetical protein [Methylotenera sp.]